VSYQARRTRTGLVACSISISSTPRPLPGAKLMQAACAVPPCLSSFLRISSARFCNFSRSFLCWSSSTLGPVGGPSLAAWKLFPELSESAASLPVKQTSLASPAQLVGTRRIVASTANPQASASAPRHAREPFLSRGHRCACRLMVHHGAHALGQAPTGADSAGRSARARHFTRAWASVSA
jgi:hypothetical protein